MSYPTGWKVTGRRDLPSAPYGAPPECIMCYFGTVVLQHSCDCTEQEVHAGGREGDSDSKRHQAKGLHGAPQEERECGANCGPKTHLQVKLCQVLGPGRW